MTERRASVTVSEIASSKVQRVHQPFAAAGAGWFVIEPSRWVRPRVQPSTLEP